MLKKFISNYFVESILVVVLAILCVVSFIFARNLDSKNEEVYQTFLTEEVLPTTTEKVNKQENEAKYSRPYNDETVKIVKDYYDYKNENNQTNAIIYYEGTYIQNEGVDYAGETPFSVLAIRDGQVISVTSDDIVGTTVKIKHDDNTISVYQSLSSATIKENDYVNKKEVIGVSGTNEIGKELKNHLHLELYINNVSVNPENYFNEGTN